MMMKVATVVKQNISIVKAEFCRDIEFVPFTFVIDDDGLPMLGDNPEPISNMSVSMIENFEYLFQARIEIRYTQLFREYQEMTGLGERSAKKHIGIALKNGILSKNNNGNYMLARNNISDEDMGPFKTLG